MQRHWSPSLNRFFFFSIQRMKFLVHFGSVCFSEILFKCSAASILFSFPNSLSHHQQQKQKNKRRRNKQCLETYHSNHMKVRFHFEHSQRKSISPTLASTRVGHQSYFHIKFWFILLSFSISLRTNTIKFKLSTENRCIIMNAFHFSFVHFDSVSADDIDAHANAFTHNFYHRMNFIHFIGYKLIYNWVIVGIWINSRILLTLSVAISLQINSIV